MKSKEVLNLYNYFESIGINIWLDGGWGVDALLEEQTRPHEDVDIVITPCLSLTTQLQTSSQR